jgi:hypothetical protein
VRLDQRTYECIFYDLRNNFLIFLVPNSILPAGRPEKSAASRSAGTLMPGIMYLQMRNGLANSFPDHLSDRPDRRRALQILGPEAEKPDPNAFADRYEPLSIEKT